MLLQLMSQCEDHDLLSTLICTSLILFVILSAELKFILNQEVFHQELLPAYRGNVCFQCFAQLLSFLL